MDIFHYIFMQRALFIGVLISIVCPVMSFFVVNRGLGFIGVGITHAAFGGMALGSFLGVNPVWTAVAFSGAAAIAIARVSRIRKVSEDTAIGIMYAAAMAVGIILIGLKKSYTVDLFGYLFGSILTVTKGDIISVAVMGGAVLIAVASFFKEFMLLCFDEEYGRTLRLPMTPLYYFLLLLIALTVVMAMKVIGIILVSALLILPAATAQIWFKNYKAVIAASIMISLVTVVAGLAASYYLNIASGATIVLLGTLVFLLSGLLNRRKKALQPAN
jgi:ABC-type Mn2+/Zn2+ transport system permease subunit